MKIGRCHGERSCRACAGQFSQHARLRRAVLRYSFASSAACGLGANGPGPALRLRVDKFPKVIDLPCATAKSAKSKAFTLKGQMATSDRRGEQLWRRQRELRARRHAPPAGRDGKWHALLAGRDGRRRALLAEQDGRSHALSAARGGRWHAPFARLDGRWRAPLARRDRRWWTPSANISFCLRRAKTNRCSALLFCIG